MYRYIYVTVYMCRYIFILMSSFCRKIFFYPIVVISLSKKHDFILNLNFEYGYFIWKTIFWYLCKKIIVSLAVILLNIVVSLRRLKTLKTPKTEKNNHFF